MIHPYFTASHLLKTTCSVLGAVCLMTAASCGSDSGYRQNLDEYVEFEAQTAIKSHAMQTGTAVYVDFSDGMNAAYGTELSQQILKSVINVFTGAKNQANFYSLANDTIVPLNLAQTEVYNAIMSGKNYTKPKAPIEKTLKSILAKRQPALLITDFEEYNGSVIQQQNYAKDYFISWLKMGYDIIFYKLDYKEGSKPKHLYFAVFDSPENALAASVESTLSPYLSQGLQRFTLAGPQTSYTLAANYPSSTKGGNYHNSESDDIVTGVVEDGGGEAFISYSYNMADSEKAKTRGGFETFTTLYTPLVEYYLLGVKWEEIVGNIAATQEEGVPEGDRYSHFLSKLYVNFAVQDGYEIGGVQAKVYNFEPSIRQIIQDKQNAEAEGKEATVKVLDNGKEVLDMFTVSLLPVKESALKGSGWKEIAVDLDARFKGQTGPSMETPSDMLKINIAVADAKPRLDRISYFFAWPGNNSLAESVRNTLMDNEVNPTGKVIVTYYVKSL